MAALVRKDLGADPLRGDVFVFIDRGRNRLKILCWDRSGFWLYAKHTSALHIRPAILSTLKNKSGKVVMSPGEILQLFDGMSFGGSFSASSLKVFSYV